MLRVETENIDLNVAEKEFAMAADSSTTANADILAAAADANNTPLARTLSIRFEDYKLVSNALVHLLRMHDLEVTAQEDQQQMNDRDAPRDTDLNPSGALGMPRPALIQAYLDSIEDQIGTVQELHEKTRQVDAIIRRLVEKDGILIELAVPTLSSAMEAGDGGTSSTAHLVVHPNYVPAEF